jgi:dTDP-4-amino-4,6-dideoxygalactose transaminase
MIPLTRPEFGDEEARAVAGVLKSGWVSQGPKVEEFETVVAARIGAAHGVATTSCTTALHLALVASGVGPGDEVICPSYSFIATANAVLYAGATPVFADIEADTWNIDPADIGKRVSPKTKAILAVHQVGLAADIDRVKSAAPKGVRLIEDAACAIGSLYQGRPVGSSGNISCLSFHPRKTISLGEGGMVLTDDGAIADHVRRLRSHGASVSDLDRHRAQGLVYEEYHELGYNYRMTDIQAAIGLEQMKRLDDLLARRRAAAVRYNTAFCRVEQIQTPAEPAYARHSYQSYAIRLRPGGRDVAARRDEAMRELIAAGVSCRRGIPPIHLEPLYRDRNRAPLPVTEAVAADSIFLPLYASLPESDQARVIETVIRIVTR